MSETKHTPGPWQVNQGTGEIIGVRDGCSMPIICTTSAWWPGKAEGTHASQDVQWANARLIASAPELLALLADVGRWLESGLSRGQIAKGTANRDGDLVTQIRAALAKAS